MIYGARIYLSKMRTVGVELEDLPIPIWAVRSILPFGFALLALRFSQVLWALIAGRSNKPAPQQRSGRRTQA